MPEFPRHICDTLSLKDLDTRNQQEEPQPDLQSLIPVTDSDSEHTEVLGEPPHKARKIRPPLDDSDNSDRSDSEIDGEGSDSSDAAGSAGSSSEPETLC